MDISNFPIKSDFPSVNLTSKSGKAKPDILAETIWIFQVPLRASDSNGGRLQDRQGGETLRSGECDVSVGERQT